MNISEKIKTRRVQLGLTLQQIADIVGVSKSTIQYWETGKTKSMKLEHIHALAKILRVDPSSLVFDDDPLTIVPEKNTLDVSSYSELDRDLCLIIMSLPLKEKIKLYNKYNKDC